jgi:NADPH:quinone reductase-like Zn-dependent oxidoreductase
MAKQMKRWELSAPGMANLHLEQADRPVPGLGEVLVKVGAVSLNYRDGAIVDGTMAGLSKGVMIPGSEIAGEIVALGPGVTRFSVGDRVITNDIVAWVDGPRPPENTNFAAIMGRLSEYAVVPAEMLSASPKTLDAIGASTLPVAALTSWFAVVELGLVRAGQTIVVQGTGGVSLFALQFAVAHGARVIVTSSSDEKISRVLALGASDGINRAEHPEWQRVVLKLTDGRGADHILEMAGGDNLARSVEAVGLGGRISIIGLLEDRELRAPIMPILTRRVTLAGIGVGHRRALEDMVRAVDRLQIKPVIDAVYSFHEAPQAFAHLKRGPFGKIVIRINN